MLRQPFVQERVIALDQFEHTAVLAHHAGEAHLRFLTQRAAQFVVQLHVRAVVLAAAPLLEHLLQFRLLFRGALVIGNRVQFLEAAAAALHVLFFTTVPRQHHKGIDVDALDVAHLQPLPDEILDQRL